MLLRVDSFPHTFKAENQSAESVISPLPPLHVCLASSKSATVLKVGRTAGDVVFGKDKSVSRSHMSLVIVSNEDYGDSDDGRPLPEVARSREEIEACEASDNGMCVVLKDTSKFGTSVVVEKDENTGGSMRDEDETGDDETDDEGAAGNHGLSQVAARLVTNIGTSSVRKLETNSSIVLTPLLRQKGKVVIQCGQYGSVIVIRRIALNIAFSRFDKKEQRMWIKRFFALGATHKEFLDKSLSYLVVRDRSSNAKNLISWCLQKPMVSGSFLQELWHRRSPSDALPQSSDHKPEAADRQTFWNDVPSTNLWRHCVQLSYARDDMESMCLAAGAKVVRIYEKSEREATKLIKQATKESTGCFYIATAAQKHAKLVRHLKKAKLRTVTPKLLATFLTTQEPLEDTHGEVIGDPVEGEEKSGDSTKNMEEENPKHSPKLSPSEKTKAESQHSKGKSQLASERASQVPTEIFTLSRGDQEETPASKIICIPESDEENVGEDQEEVTKPRSAQSQRQQAKKRSQDKTQPPHISQEGPNDKQKEWSQPKSQPTQRSQRDSDDRQLSQPKKRSEPNSQPTQRSQRGEKSSQDVRDGWHSQTKKRTRDEVESGDASQGDGHKRRTQHSSNHDDPQEEGEPEEVDPNQNSTSKRARPDDDHEEDEPVNEGPRKLRKSRDGWFVAAPSGRGRKSYRRTDEDIREQLGGEELPPTAPSERRKGLIVKPFSRQQNDSNTNSARAGVKDFKRFRKNRVLSSRKIRRVAMISVLPKESEVQRQLEEDQRRLEAEQRKIDALFQDRSNSIRSHFGGRKKRTRRV